ncbi:MAG: HD domain-containing protein [bacterium]|nr:HD domain-containing protein [bacterium]
MKNAIKRKTNRVTRPLIVLNDIRNSVDIKAYIQQADKHLDAIGYTEHGQRHASIVSARCQQILTDLGFSDREAELGAIAGYMHDIGNVISRHDHGQIAALLALRILEKLGMDAAEIAIIIGAIGNHDDEEGQGEPVSNVGSALIIADKSDVHHTRVRNPKMISFDIHDRVNYAVRHSELKVDKSGKKIWLELNIDTSISQVMEYFEIFLTRMIVSRRAAQFLGCQFGLIVNQVTLL